jgi:hypothetical protein
VLIGFGRKEDNESPRKKDVIDCIALTAINFAEFSGRFDNQKMIIDNICPGNDRDEFSILGKPDRFVSANVIYSPP